MVTYLVRRVSAAVLILLGASFVVYLLTAASGDPLQELRSSTSANRPQLIAQRTELLHLNVPAPLRYFIWLRGAAGCLVPFAGSCDLGKNLQGQPVTEQLGTAMVQTLSLVSAAALLAVVIGVTLGIVTALRRHSALDYGVTFLAFLFFSLPVFWAAVLLKEYGAIGFNNFLSSPRIPAAAVLLIAAVVCAVAALGAGGGVRRRMVAGGSAGAATAAVLTYVSAADWFSAPGLGPVAIALSGAGAAFGFTALTAGLHNTRALYAAFAAAATGVASYFAVQGLLDRATPLMIMLLAAATILAAVLIGFLLGGDDRRGNITAASLTGLLVGLVILIDRFMQAWPAYFSDSRIHGRPIATIGAATPGLEGDLWVTGLDRMTHLLLPTAALVLISIASYTRYARSSMLDVMNMDYVRTARAKGLPEFTVVLRHAFRNALMPLTTIAAVDIGGLIGGAVITESVFSYRGMGSMFVDGLRQVDPNPVMAFFVVVAITALACNLLADLVYAALDPRVKVGA
ncbi:ABC transporter permease [Paenarthrobacter sp. PH39-S1]|uniref:ABC transporter permease n=1 Tax=Paenarthrobacter sp. PH39-S1 TaxID=3046204 RepID=UPI0024BAEDCB|nr:ABC transporter permease [Paenarthrobacter sp. PH39-S1]MDJ0355654.1 ABC transporter permease [Paenarthrobacter sp. PH39-S1]